MKYRRGIHLKYHTIFGWSTLKSKLIHIWRILLNKPLTVVVNIQKKDANQIEEFWRIR